VTGKVAEILVAEGEVVPVGTVLVTFAVDGGGEAEAEEPVAAAAAAARPHVFALPSVRKLAHDLGVDLGSLVPSGPGSRVTADDVRAAAGNGHREDKEEPAPARRATAARGDAPLTGVRRAIARHVEAAAQVPAVTIVEECDVTEMAATRAAAPRELSHVSFVLKACAHALRDHPDLNAVFEDGHVRHCATIDIGVAVHTNAGLVVPVVRRVDERTLGQVDDDIARLSTAARDGKLSRGDLEGGSFTVTSPGALGGIMATPLINVPQVAILGVHRIAPRPVVRDDQIVIRTMTNLSLTFDHRVLDGVPAARFLADVVRTLEHPGLLLL